MAEIPTQLGVARRAVVLLLPLIQGEPGKGETANTVGWEDTAQEGDQQNADEGGVFRACLVSPSCQDRIGNEVKPSNS